MNECYSLGIASNMNQVFDEKEAMSHAMNESYNEILFAFSMADKMIF